MTSNLPLFQPVIQAGILPWYAVRTRSNQESLVYKGLAGKGLETYLPTYRYVRRWSDRVVEGQRPWFPGYMFCRFPVARRLPVLATPGVVSVLGFGADPIPVPDSEIESIRQVLASGLAAESCPFLKEGRRVRLTRGPLRGVEGILVEKKTNWKLVVSVELLQRSLSVEVDSDAIKAL